MPLVKVKVNVIAELDGTLKVIGKLIELPSLALASPIVTTGNGVASFIVAVPVTAVGAAVLPDVTVAVTVKVSGPSEMPSVVVGTFTDTLV